MGVIEGQVGHRPRAIDAAECCQFTAGSDAARAGCGARGACGRHVGCRAAYVRPGAGLREAARAVQPRDRQFPGGEAPVRRHGDDAGAVSRDGVVCGLRAGCAAGRGAADRVADQGASRRCRPRHSAHGDRGAWRHGLHRSARAALLVQAHQLQSPDAGWTGTLPRGGRAAARMDHMIRSFIDSSDLIGDGTALAARMRRDGYLFLPGLLPRDDVAAVQRQVGAIAREAGWLRRDRPAEAAIADLSGFCVDPDPTYLRVLRRINRIEDYHALKHHPVLIDLLERMLGGPILPHPRVLMRNIFPEREEYTTKAHQDFPNVQGTTEVYTAWMPLIDCPMDVGPLQVATGSHTGGVHEFDIGLGAGGIEISDAFEDRWVSGEFAVGDVLIFHSLMVHKGVP